ncbi:MAG TPA: cobalamin-binding protein [Pyrinomonadaceae bacterium]|nr:cobalamin-binding protein [Pyrinomonadaceae bacterium]
MFRHHNSTTRLFRIALILCAALTLVGGCSSPNKQPEQKQITDEAGRSIKLPAKVERVITLAPNLTEIVYAIGAGDRLVGNTTYCDYPEQAKTVQKVGDTLQPNIEKILGLQPDLILVSTSSQLEAFTRQLDEHNIPVFVTDPHNIEGVLHSIHNVGVLLDRREAAQALKIELTQRVGLIEQALGSRPPIRVFYQLSAEPLYTAGRDAFVTDLIKRAGGLSVTADVPEAWPRYSEESAVAARPEAIILPTGGSMGAANSDVAAGLKKAPAVVNGKVIKIDGDLLVRPGPRAIDGLEQLAHALHPDAFK